MAELEESKFAEEEEEEEAAAVAIPCPGNDVDVDSRDSEKGVKFSYQSTYS